MKSISLEKQDELIDRIITLETFSYPAQEFEFWEKSETKQTLEKYRKEIEKIEKVLMELLDKEGKKELQSLIDILEKKSLVEKENSFNNGVRSGLTNLAFLKDYFDTF